MLEKIKSIKKAEKLKESPIDGIEKTLASLKQKWDDQKRLILKIKVTFFILGCFLIPLGVYIFRKLKKNPITM